MACYKVRDAVSVLFVWILLSPNIFSEAQLYIRGDSVDVGESEYIDSSSEWYSSDWNVTWSEYTWEDLECLTESCHFPQRFRLCRCDNLCDFFRDCCKDFNSTDSLDSALIEFKNPDLWQCVHFGTMCADLVPSVYDEGFQLISDCPESWSNETVRISCQEKDATVPVVLDERGLHFRSKHCAMCNGANMDTLQIYLDFRDHPCPTYDFKCAFFPFNYDVINETISSDWVPDAHLCFDDMIHSCPLDANVSENTRSHCEKDYAPAIIGGFFRNRECALCLEPVPLPDYFSKCPGKNLNHDAYASCVGEPVYIYLSFFEYTETQQLVAKIFFGISCAALMVTFLTYCFFSSLRNVQGILVMQFIIALFMAQVFMQFLAPTLKEKSFSSSIYFSKQGTTICVAVAFVSHFFSLAAFSLMSIMAFDLSRSLVFSHTVARRESVSKKRLLLYSVYGWGFPIIIVGPCLGVHIYSVKNQTFNLFYYGGSDCWLHPSMRTIQAFLVPVSICLFFNFILFVRIVCQLLTIKKECQVLKRRQNNEQQRKDTIATLRLYIKISCLFGFGWLFGYLGAFVDVSQLWYLFIVLNSLQGVLFFFSFGMNVRTRKLWLDASSKRLGQFASFARSSFASSSSKKHFNKDIEVKIE